MHFVQKKKKKAQTASGVNWPSRLIPSLSAQDQPHEEKPCFLRWGLLSAHHWNTLGHRQTSIVAGGFYRLWLLNSNSIYQCSKLPVALVVFHLPGTSIRSTDCTCPGPAINYRSQIKLGILTFSGRCQWQPFYFTMHVIPTCRLYTSLLVPFIQSCSKSQI